MLVQQRPAVEDSFQSQTDNQTPLKQAQPASHKPFFSSSAIKAFIVVGVLITVSIAASYLMAPNPSKPTSLSSMDDSSGKENNSADRSQNKTIKPPKDQQEEKDKNPESGEMKVDSGGDGEEPPNNNRWNAIYRGGINAGVGLIPVKKDEVQSIEVEVVDGVVINGSQSESEKQKSSAEDTDDEDQVEQYNPLFTSFRPEDPRFSSLGSVRP